MGKNSAISWTTHTFNPWWGCQRVSPGCEHCYAETLDARWYDGAYWGSMNGRKEMKPAYWNQVYGWNIKAQKSDKPTLVFCASMADVFEDRPELSPLRGVLWKLIRDTPDLTWLLLTKRPENVARLVPEDWLVDYFPSNVWLGVSVENQAYIHRVAQIEDFRVNRFVSVEPMLGHVDFQKYWWAVDWVICGGESGMGCRPMESSWAMGLMNACEYRHIPFFMKQLGGHPDKRDDMKKWIDIFQVQQFPDFEHKELDISKGLPK